MEKEPLYYMEEKKRRRLPRLNNITVRPNDGLKIAFFIPMVIMVIRMPFPPSVSILFS